MRGTTALAFAALLSTTGCAAVQQKAIQATGTPPTPAAVTTPAPRPTADVAAFCGPSTSHQSWRTQLATLADIGVTAVHGYCYTPVGYTVLDTGTRYPTQAEYLELAAGARAVGLGVIVYDPTFWTDPDAAAETWADFITDGTLVAVDLGDEPDTGDLAELNRRAQLVRTAGVEPQVIFFPGYFRPLAESYQALPTACPISNDYTSNVTALADARLLRSLAGCSGITVDTTGRDMDADGDIWSTALIRASVAERFRITLFTGVQPENFPEWDALVDDHGQITPTGRAVRASLAGRPSSPGG
jgi:hypothetical protein